MQKEQIISFILTAAISITTGMVSGTVTVTTLKNDVYWIKTKLNDQEIRIRRLESRSLGGVNHSN